MRVEASIVEHALNLVLHKEQQITEPFLNNDKKLKEWEKVPIVPSNLDIGNIAKATISAISSKVESLLNEKGAITKAASFDERLRTAKVYNYFVPPTSRNRGLLTCKYKIFAWYNFCTHSVAVACELNIWFDYFVEV